MQPEHGEAHPMMPLPLTARSVCQELYDDFNSIAMTRVFLRSGDAPLVEPVVEGCNRQIANFGQAMAMVAANPETLLPARDKALAGTVIRMGRSIPGVRRWLRPGPLRRFRNPPGRGAARAASPPEATHSQNRGGEQGACTTAKGNDARSSENAIGLHLASALFAGRRCCPSETVIDGPSKPALGNRHHRDAGEFRAINGP